MAAWAVLDVALVVALVWAELRCRRWRRIADVRPEPVVHESPPGGEPIIPRVWGKHRRTMPGDPPSWWQGYRPPGVTRPGYPAKARRV